MSQARTTGDGYHFDRSGIAQAGNDLLILNNAGNTRVLLKQWEVSFFTGFAAGGYLFAIKYGVGGTPNLSGTPTAIDPASPAALSNVGSTWSVLPSPFNIIIQAPYNPKKILLWQAKKGKESSLKSGDSFTLSCLTASLAQQFTYAMEWEE